MLRPLKKNLPWFPGFKVEDGPLTEKLRLEATRNDGGLPLVRHSDQSVHSVCGFCSTGCSLEIHLQSRQPVHVTPSVTYPVNRGNACPKGWEAIQVLQSKDRATTPLARNASGSMEAISWQEAALLFCDRIKSIQSKYGPDSLAFISTGQIPTEEMAFLGCLAKFGMGIRHGDGNTRQCMATSVVAYKEAFGFDAPPFTYSDLEESDLLIFVGANPCIAHPILWQRVLANPHSPKIIVIDPRVTETAMCATEHLALRPKSDLALLYGLANELIRIDGLDHAFIDEHTSRFDAFKEHVRTYTLDRVAQETGIGEERLSQVAAQIAQHQRVSFWWTMGVNQSYQGVRTAQAIINLALMTGNIGRPGTGANSITGQCNAMGSRLYSNTTNLIGHHDYANESHRNKVASILDIPVESIPQEPCWSYDQILQGIEDGKVKGLWVVATNTAHSWIGSERARALLAKLDFLVVQDMYRTTETAEYADLLLPAAGWGEKEGTFINSERRVGVIHRVAAPPGQALSDFSIFRLLANEWGCGTWFETWTHPEAVFEKLKSLSRNQPCDMTGMRDYQKIEQSGGMQWPYTQADAALPSAYRSERRLFEDGHFYHPDHRARFLFEEAQEMPEPPCKEFPLVLLTGRGSASQWHTETRTRQSPLLQSLHEHESYVEMHADDAKRFSLSHGDMVDVKSRRGTARARLKVTNTVLPGCVFMPMHDVQVNRLTLEHLDPYSRQPSYKDAAVTLLPVKGTRS